MPLEALFEDNNQSEFETGLRAPPRNLRELREGVRAEAGPIDEAEIYPPQKEVAGRLFSRMSAVKPLGEFDSLAFYVISPCFNSLHKQTTDRLADFAEAQARTEVDGPAKEWWAMLATNAETFSFKAYPGGRDLPKWQAMVSRIESEPRTLFIVAIDECHWATTSSGQPSDNSDGGALDKFINDEHVRNPRSGNVLRLFVSATPYNLQTKFSQIPSENEVSWFEDNTAVSDSSYYGISDFVEKSRSIDLRSTEDETGFISQDPSFEDAVAKSRPTAVREKARARADELLYNYKAALATVGGLEGHEGIESAASPFTMRMVEHL